MEHWQREKEGWENRGEDSWTMYVHDEKRLMWIVDIFPDCFKIMEYYPDWVKDGWKFITYEEYLSE